MQRSCFEASEPLRFLVDENLPAAVATMLRALGHDVLDVAASTYRSAPDARIWQIAIDELRVLVTRDLDFPLPRVETVHLGS
jgi:predicted nuclease of predicted toxin-antitoxin system